MNGYAQVTGDGEGGTLTIAQSNSPDAVVNLSWLGNLVIEATATIGRFGLPTSPGWMTYSDTVEQGDPRSNASVINNGTILGAVELGYGDDFYDGRLGSTGGTIYGYAGNDRLYGGAGNDIIAGGFGADDLFGGGGNDTLIGGGGGDRLYGEAGNDSYIVDNQADLVFEAAAEGTDSVTASVGHYLYANVENLVLAADAGGIFGVGNALANSITGNGSANLLLGGGGNDAIAGGAGGDSVFGEAGDDVINGDAGVDYLVGGSGNDTLNGGDDADAVYGEDGDDVILGGTGFFTDILVGGFGNDVLMGNSGLGDYDLMDGGAGDDVYRVDTPADLTFEAAGGGTDTVRADINGAGYYLYAHVENLVLEGNTPFGVGNELANELTGSAVANYLLGGLGNDTLNGKGGNDVLFGEGGADIFVFERGTGGDTIGDFAPGADKISLKGLGITSFAQVQGLMVQVGGNSAIDLGLGDFIVLNGVTNAQLSAGDFLFG
jgi:Ca2+-binding RTX toxin-like protein